MPLLLLGGSGAGTAGGGGNWNGEFAGSGRRWAVLTAGESARDFWEATLEREKAANLARGLPPSFDSIPTSGSPVIQADSVPGSDPVLGDTTYERVRFVAFDLARHFVRKVQADGTSNYWPEGTNHIDSCRQEGSGGGSGVPPTFAAIVFPAGTGAPAGSPGGFSRRFELEIYATTNPAAVGTRARFVAFNGSVRFYGVRTSDAGFGGAPSTPAGEVQYDGKLFDSVAGAWVLSADQTSPPQTVTETGVTRRYRGDFHDGRCADEIRDGFNQLTRTAGFAENNPGLGVSQVPPYTGVAQTSFNGGTADSTGATQKGGSSSVSQAAANAAYAASATSPTVNAFAQTGKGDANLDGITDGWSVSAGRATFVVPGDQYASNASMPNPLGQSRRIHFFAYCTAQGTWDDQGRADVQQDVWHEVPGAASNSGTSITGPVFGDLSLPPNWPPGVTGQLGFIQFLSYYLLDWDTTGGFAFTTSTP